MAKRITIMIDEDLDRQLRILQSNAIRNYLESLSFSKTVNITVKFTLDQIKHNPDILEKLMKNNNKKVIMPEKFI